MNTTARTATRRILGGATMVGIAGALLAANPASAATTPDVLLKIRACESGGNYTAVNASSGASGAYQFLDSTWRGLSASQGYSTAATAPAAVQDAAALELYNQAGTSPWLASQSCWGSMSSVPTSTSNTSGTGSGAATTSTFPTSTSTTSSTSRSATRAGLNAPTASATKKATTNKKMPKLLTGTSRTAERKGPMSGKKPSVKKGTSCTNRTVDQSTQRLDRAGAHR